MAKDGENYGHRYEYDRYAEIHLLAKEAELPLPDTKPFFSKLDSPRLSVKFLLGLGVWSDELLARFGSSAGDKPCRCYSYQSRQNMCS